ncbi:TonB-dependent receptor [Geothrix sp. 21YS21S-2]|uniref:TonB-dependent receptor n=1 Tax=Geothrix sp. 21YS21S-2 TaxID=3068893 RepID=UPI0027B91749|nr:TonB-dependent receptor [Geothrix sp. 21YS21S-2]
MNSAGLRFSRLIPLIICGAPLLAQGVSTQLAGRITAKGAGPLAKANVVVRNVETGHTRTVMTDENGRYFITALPVGPYTVSVTKQGFQTATNLKVTLNLGDAAPLNVAMIPAASAVVEVVASVAAVDSDRTTNAAFVSTELLTTMPNFNRSFTNLATLTPMVTIDTSRGGLAIAGQRGVSSSMNVDGGDNNEPFFGGSMNSNNAFQISMEAIREYQVITAGASAEFGRMGGGYLNAITKNGTNDLTGSLFYYKRPQSMVAKQPNLSGVAGSNNVGDFKQNQFGFSVGGPIVKDKLFYFVAYDGQRMNSPVNFVWGGNSPVALNSALTNDAVLISKIRNYDVPNDADTVFVRFDWNLTTDHTLQLHINQSKNKTMAYTGTTSAYENTVNDQYKTLSLVGQWNWTINANLLNEVRVNYGKDEMPRTTNSSIPEVSISNVGYYGANPYPREYQTTRKQVTEALSFVTPVLQIKAGIDYNKIGVAETFSSGYQGIYYFNNSGSGATAKTAFQNFQAGNWASYAQRFSLIPGLNGWDAGRFDVSEEQIAAYVQVDVRATDTLKLGLGIRMDRQTHPDFPIADFSNRLATTMPLTGKMPTDTQVSPRLSATWTPTFDKGNSVVRASIGRYVSTTPSVYEYQLYTVNGVRMANITFYNPTPGLGYGASFNAANPASLSSIPTGAAIPKTDIYSFDPNFKNPHTDQATVGLDRGFGHGLTIGLSGIYSRGHNLERLVDLNLGTPVANAQGRLIFPTTTVGGSTPLRPNANYGKMMMYTSDVDSIYHAYSLSMKYQEEGSPFFAQVNYTYAIDKDQDSNERNFSGFSTANPQRLSDEWGFSDKDRRHTLTAQLSYLETRFTGIQTGFVVRYLSGLPYSLVYSSDLNKDGNTGYDRVYADGKDTGRNSQRQGSTTTIDMKLSRDFNLVKKVKFQVSAEIFNLLNRHDTYSWVKAAGTDAATTYTRTPTWLGSARQVQLGARLTF